MDGRMVKFGGDGRFEDDRKHKASTLRKYASIYFVNTKSGHTTRTSVLAHNILWPHTTQGLTKNTNLPTSEFLDCQVPACIPVICLPAVSRSHLTDYSSGAPSALILPFSRYAEYKEVAFVSLVRLRRCLPKSAPPTSPSISPRKKSPTTVPHAAGVNCGHGVVEWTVGTGLLVAAIMEGHPVAVVRVEVAVAKLQNISLHSGGKIYASFKGIWSSTDTIIKG